jgi:quinol monooxygenase YgiN
MSQVNPIDQLRAQVSQMLDRLDPEMPIAATVVFKALKSKESTFIRNTDALADATRKLPGCNVFAYHKRRPANGSAGHPEFLIYEDWETTKLFRAQWDSDHLKQFQYSVVQLIADLPDLRWYYGWSESATGGRVPRTGQRKCWTTSGAPIDCAGTGQDGAVNAGVTWPKPRFNNNGDGTVTDKLTGLIWLQDADRFGEVSWEQALVNVRHLASGSCELADGSRAGDWRLPNIRELFSLIDYGSGAPIIPKGHPFKNVKCAIYWTGTSLASAPSLAWMMTLGIGPTVFDLKINPNRMWPVRGKSHVPRTGQQMCWDQRGQPLPTCAGSGQDGDLRAGVLWPTPRFTDNADGTVTDNLTNLVWLHNANPFGFRTWDQALKDCNGLASGSHGLTDGSKAGDWHLPNIREIESLVDYNRFGPCLRRGIRSRRRFDRRAIGQSTSVAAAPTQAMFIISESGGYF